MWDLLLSRRFQTAIVGVIVALFIHLVPELEGKESELGGIVATIILALLGSYTLDHTTYNLGVGKAEAQAGGANEVTFEIVDEDGTPANPWEPYPPDAGGSSPNKRVPPNLN